jgi:drug/metabolite transporter (DMT)-like permease
MVIATVLWGATFVILRDVLRPVPPATLVALRFAAAAVVLGLAVAATGRRIDRAAWMAGAQTALPTAGGYLFQAIGLTEIRAGSSAFLTCTGTLFAAFWAWPLLRQRPDARLLAGMGVAALGSLLLSERPDLRLARGDLWTLAGALLYALQIALVARWVGRVDPMALLATQSAIVALLMAPWAHPRALSLTGAAWARIAYLALAATMVAPLLQVRAQRVLPAGRIGMLFALEPVFGLLFALGFGGERFGWRWWLGAVLIVCAVLWVERGAERARPTSRAASAGSEPGSPGPR